MSLLPRLRELADHALGVRAFGHALDVLGRDLAAQRLFHFLAAGVVLERPAGVADRAHVDEADLERLVGGGRRRDAAPARQRSGERGQQCGALRRLRHVLRLPGIVIVIGRGAGIGGCRARRDEFYPFSAVGMERLAQRRRRVEADRGRVARDDRQHDDGRDVGQHRQELRRDRHAQRLRLELRERDAAEQIRAGQHAPRLPGREHDQRQRDPAAARGHALGPQRRVGDRQVRAAQAGAGAAEQHREIADARRPDSRSRAPTAAIRRPRARRARRACGYRNHWIAANSTSDR